MIDPLWDYCLQHTSPPSDVLKALERDTHLRTLSPQMLSGPYQGTLLRLFSHMLRPRRILEIGTFTGYTAICMAEGLTDDGLLHTIEVNDELAWLIQKHVQASGLAPKIRLHLGDAAHIIPTLEEVFDLVFLDAGKLDYPAHFELALAKTRSGGIIIADNVLWDGKVVRNDPDETAQLLRRFNASIQQDARFDNVLLPLRDGLLVVRVR
jgi:caffeoyl-CoA O-methyltransferase